MRLLNVHTLEFTEFEVSRPLYVTASHRWTDQEASLEDVRSRRNTDSPGFKKVKGFTNYIQKHIPHVQWLWLDTCCLDQENAEEVTSAVNSMFSWYAESELCVAYLADVAVADDVHAFQKSVWFSRGWTLQELLAPCLVVFASRDWATMGYKGGDGLTKSGVEISRGPSLGAWITAVTSIPEEVLKDFDESRKFTVREKRAWANGRQTSKPEDEYYCLMWIFDVQMRMDYGEGAENARRRLYDEIARTAELPDHANMIQSLLFPSESGRLDRQQRRVTEVEPRTGTWLLESAEYIRWKGGATRHCWLRGRPGSGKSILFSIVVEDVRIHCENKARSAFATYHFALLDDRLSTVEGLLLSLVARLSQKEPALRSLLADAPSPSLADLNRILTASFDFYDEVFVLVDALDECTSGQAGMLEELARLARENNCKLFVTGRAHLAIQHALEQIGTESISVDSHVRDTTASISSFLELHIEEDEQLAQLAPPVKRLIRDELAKRAEGVFHLAYCQLQELKAIPLISPNDVVDAIHGLPVSLDDAYERILLAIHPESRRFAASLLMWLAYVKRPLLYEEVADALLIDLGGFEDTNPDSTAPIRYVIDALSSFVIVSGDGVDMASKTIRLAHISIKDFLESDRILRTNARLFHISAMESNSRILNCCLTCLTIASMNSHNGMSSKMLSTHPLLGYAVESWHLHYDEGRHQSDTVKRIAKFLGSDLPMELWIRLYGAKHSWWQVEPVQTAERGTALYFACRLGLITLANHLSKAEQVINARGGFFGTPLQAAAWEGHKRIVQMLLENGADVNLAASCGAFGSPLNAAAARGHDEIIRELLDRGADINAAYISMFERPSDSSMSHPDNRRPVAKPGKMYTALTIAALENHWSTVALLVERGADVVAAQGTEALEYALGNDNGRMARFLLQHGADGSRPLYQADVDHRTTQMGT